MRVIDINTPVIGTRSRLAFTDLPPGYLHHGVIRSALDPPILSSCALCSAASTSSNWNLLVRSAGPEPGETTCPRSLGFTPASCHQFTRTSGALDCLFATRRCRTALRISA